MVQRTRIPILLLTGFLGSGKTTLLSKWLRAPEFAGAMVIVNELGEVGLDDRLVQFSSEAPILLENGCACCEAAEDLNATLERLFWQRLHRQIPAFEWVLIETTGIADPAPIMAAIGSNDLVAGRYRLAGVVTALDVRTGPARISQHPECRSQIVQADAIILTRTDLAEASQTAATRAGIEQLRPDVAMFESAKGNLPASTVLETLRQRETVPPSVAQSSGLPASHSADVTSAFAAIPDPVSWAAIEAALVVVLQRHGKRILRLKGVANIDRLDNPQVIQAASGEAVERSDISRDANTAGLRTGLTIIAQFVPADFVAREFLSLLPRDSIAPNLPAFPECVRG